MRGVLARRSDDVGRSGGAGGPLGDTDAAGRRTAPLSPPFELDGSASATLRYARWYSNDTGASPGADVFNVDLSDDGGVSWTSAEVVGPTGARQLLYTGQQLKAQEALTWGLVNEVVPAAELRARVDKIAAKTGCVALIGCTNETWMYIRAVR